MSDYNHNFPNEIITIKARMISNRNVLNQNKAEQLREEGWTEGTSRDFIETS